MLVYLIKIHNIIHKHKQRHMIHKEKENDKPLFYFLNDKN